MYVGWGLGVGPASSLKDYSPRAAPDVSRAAQFYRACQVDTAAGLVTQGMSNEPGKYHSITHTLKEVRC